MHFALEALTGPWGAGSRRSRRQASLLLGIALIVLRTTGSSASAISEPSLPGFSIEHRDGMAWLKKPGGERFFSFGVCCVDQGISPAKYKTNNPGFAAWQHYSNSTEWAQSTLQRLTNWGFTTIGGWSDYQALRERQEADVAFTPVLHMGSTAGAPWWDMWDSEIVGRMEQVARDQILALRNEPRLLGYYSDNEMGWWNAALLDLTLKQRPSSGQRGRLMDLLRQTYHHDWNELLKDFDPENAASFQELDQGGTLFLRPGGKGHRTLRRFLGLMADRYYALVREIIRKYDQRALILGDRYQSFYYPEVARSCAKYMDAVSSNLNAGWNDGTFPRYFLHTLHSLTGKPILITEFYLAARENRSGNNNSNDGFPIVDTQSQRVEGFQTTVRALARLPWVIGADWFQYYDEPTHGRDDGEDFNFGLVDIHNQPYLALTKAAAALNLSDLRRQPQPPRPDASQGVPPAPMAPLDNFKPSLALKHWDRERGFVPAASEFPLADLYLCWDEAAIYLGIYAQDIVEDTAYRTRSVPAEDRAEWIVRLDGANPIRARIGAGMPVSLSEPAVRLVNLSGVNLRTRNIAAMALPAQLFGRDKFKPGDSLDLASTYAGHGRMDRVEWKGKFTLLPPIP